MPTGVRVGRLAIVRERICRGVAPRWKGNRVGSKSGVGLPDFQVATPGGARLANLSARSLDVTSDEVRKVGCNMKGRMFWCQDDWTSTKLM